MADKEQIDYGSHETYVKWFLDSEDLSQESRKLSERDIDYYNCIQLTQSELNALKKRKQPPVVDNRIKPKIDYLLGFERSQRTDPKAFPRTPKHEDAANAATDALRYVIESNDFPQVRSECFEDALKPGAYGCEVIVKPRGKDFDILIKRTPWDRIFYDPHSRARDFSDAKYKGIVIWMDKADALDRYKGNAKADSILGDTMSQSQSSTYEDKPSHSFGDAKRNRVRIVQMYFKKGGVWHYAEFTGAGFLKGPKPSPYLDEYGDPDCPLEFQSAFVDREGNRFGLVRQWIDMQDEVNKRRSKGLHLLTMRQVVYEDGAVDDINTARNELAKPDGAVKVTPNMKFDVLPTNDMAAGNFQMLADARASIDASGPNSTMTGHDERQLSGRAVALKSQAGNMEVGPLMDGLRAWQKRVYRQVWNRIRQYWTAEKWIRVTDDENNLKWVGLNVPSTAGEQLVKQLEAQGQKISQEEIQQLMMDPQAQQPAVENEVAELMVDIILEDAPDTVTIQQEQFESMVAIFPSVPPQLQPLAFEMLVEASSLRNKKQFLEKLKGGGEDPEAAEMQRMKAEEAEQIKKEEVLTKIDKTKAEAMRAMAQAEATLNPPANTAQELAMQGDTGTV